MSIYTTMTWKRSWAIERIKEVKALIDDKNWIEIATIAANEMLGDLLDYPLFRKSPSENYIVVYDDRFEDC